MEELETDSPSFSWKRAIKMEIVKADFVSMENFAIANKRLLHSRS